LSMEAELNPKCGGFIYGAGGGIRALIYW